MSKLGALGDSLLLLGGVGAAMGAGKLGKDSGDDFIETGRRYDNELTKDALEDIRRISEQRVNIGNMRRELTLVPGARDNAFYTDEKNYKKYSDKLLAKEVTDPTGSVAVGSNIKALPVIAHELGHSANNEAGIIKNRIRKERIGLLLTAIGVSAPVLARDVLSRVANTAGKAGKIRKLRGLTLPISMGIAGLGGLIGSRGVRKEEAEATRKAIEYLRRSGRSEEQLKKDKDLLDKALNSYKTQEYARPLLAAGLTGALYGGTGLINKLSRIL